MADRSKNPAPAADSSRRGRKMVLLALTAALLVVAAAVSGVVAVRHILVPLWFDENPRMTIRQVKISSGGYWNGNGYWNNRESELLRRLGVRRGMTLFGVDPGALRGKLERIPCVESARVYRVLPDTLRMELVERTPRAVLFDRASPLVTDEKGMVIERRESLVANGRWDLPLISGVSLRYQPGQKDPRLAPAMELIMQTRSRYPNFNIREVAFTSPERMECFFNYGGGRIIYRAVFPVRQYESRIDGLLLALESALIDMRRSGEDKRNFNLSFDGQVVIN
ncbi:MAG: FtsQ-type POTRA domain-containing protein [Lentisphaeria bacterium]|nr:FtsQ-type POTRA domain-containing protein [Lentisphaeria bacterium]